MEHPMKEKEEIFPREKRNCSKEKIKGKE